MIDEKERITSSISQMDDADLSDIVKLVIDRYHTLHSGWDMQVFVLPVDDPEAYSIYLERAIASVQKHKPKTPA